MKLSIFDKHGNIAGFWNNLCKVIGLYTSDINAELALFNGKSMPGTWHIEFESEADLTWFLLKWS